MMRQHPLVRDLLEYAAGGHAGLARMRSSSQAEVEWVVAAGQGALACSAFAAGALVVPEPALSRFKAADLMARVRSAVQAETTAEVLGLLAGVGIVPVLLKGVSIAYECYPEPHLRPRGDIDLLLPAGTYPCAERTLKDAGYAQPDAPVMHHGPPLHDRGRDTWVELHTELFWPPHAPLRRGITFTRATADLHTRPSSWQGHAVLRFSPEYQLAYIASSWMNDIITTTQCSEPSYLASLFDIVYLLRRHAGRIEWDALERLLGTPMARASTFVALDYVRSRGLGDVPDALLAQLVSGQRYVGRFQARRIHSMIDGYLVAGRRWRYAFPPPVPGRYRFGYQWSKRVRRQLGEGY